MAGSGLQTSTSGRSLASSDQASTSTVATTTPAAAAAAALQRGQALVGAEYADEEVKETKLTKAQKKNLKRSEKKKLESGPEGEEGAAGEGEGAAAAATAAGSGSDPRQAVTSTSAAAAATRRSGGGAASGSASASHQRVASRGSDDPDQAADAEAAAVMEELCINSIVARKVLALITQLQRLGAPEFVAAAAVQRYGSNVMSALEWLLVAGADAAASSPEVVLAAAAESPSAAASEVDISEELQQLSDLQVRRHERGAREGGWGSGLPRQVDRDAGLLPGGRGGCEGQAGVAVQVTWLWGRRMGQEKGQAWRNCRGVLMDTLGRLGLACMDKLMTLRAGGSVAPATGADSGGRLSPRRMWCVWHAIVLARGGAGGARCACTTCTCFARRSAHVHRLTPPLQAAMGVPTELLQQCMVDCNGDVQAAANVALERLLAAPSGSAASLRGAAGNSRSGSPAVRGSGSGAMQLQPSASFYSVSSLDGSAAEAAASAAAASAKPRSHFGVRLQDDPVEGDGGAGATAGGGLGGYGDYASGLLRGSVVLGASGWANGYGSTASPGAGATASAAGNGAVAGSRLSRWLRDESGHGAGQDEEAAAAGPSSSRLRNGLLSPTDPVLESPFASHSDMARGLAASGKAATSETPSLGSWLSSNGYHHSMGLGHGGQPSGTGHFSFVSAMSKPTASMAAGGGGGGGLEPLAEYGSRWSSSLATPAHPMPPPGFGGRGGGAAEAEAVQHGDIGGEGDLASIMGLINGK